LFTVRPHLTQVRGKLTRSGTSEEKVSYGFQLLSDKEAATIRPHFVKALRAGMNLSPQGAAAMARQQL
jgi:hypothetical protein